MLFRVTQANFYYLCGMFVRKKKNRSGTISVVVVDKSGGRFREIKKFGVAASVSEADALCERARQWVRRYGGQLELDFDGIDKTDDDIRYALSHVSKFLLNASQSILGRVYDSIGFGQIDDDVLRHLVIARVCEPQSKLATSAYLKSYFDEDVSHFRIYRYMDKLYSTQQEEVQRISVEHTRKILGGEIGLMFYDVTTLYFERAPGGEDDIRQSGFSKDGKTAEAQIVLGLLVSKDDYPLAYSIFNGSQYEGFTMIPVIDDFVRRFSLDDFVVVADSGLMSTKNIKLLRAAQYKYVIGARIKNESSDIKEWILSLPKDDKNTYEYVKQNGDRLIVSYSEKRARKDAHNRQKGVERLKKAFRSEKITKDKINRRGYNKFLEITKDVRVTISQDKIDEDARWDGLKGYITNTSLDAEDVISKYTGLWVVERAFRISKGNLEMRPIFHFTERRIEAHICICFMAYKVYKELQRVLPEYGIDMSVNRVLDIAKTIPTVYVDMPNGSKLKHTLFLTEEQRKIKPLLGEK